MKSILLNHPYKNMEKDTVIPKKVFKRGAESFVLYQNSHGPEKLMTVSDWNDTCKPVIFKTKEGA